MSQLPERIWPGIAPATSPMVDRYSTNSAIGGRISLSTKCNVSSFRDQTPGEGQFCQQQLLSRGNDTLALWTGRSGQPLLTNGELPKFETGQTKADIISSTNSAFHKPVQNALLNFESQPKSKNYRHWLRQLWLYYHIKLCRNLSYLHLTFDVVNVKSGSDE